MNYFRCSYHRKIANFFKNSTSFRPNAKAVTPKSEISVVLMFFWGKNCKNSPNIFKKINSKIK